MKHELVHGWAGNKDGFKEEMFTRHNSYHKKIAHNECQQCYDRLICSNTKVSSVYPAVTTFSTQISKGLNEQLRAKFVGANLVATDFMSDLKFKPILDSYEQLGVNVGNTHRNSQGLAIFNAVHADCIVDETIKELEGQRFFGLQGDGSHDNARKPQSNKCASG